MPVERNTSRPRGFGFVTMATREAAENAISKMDQAQLDGRTIRVNESRPRGEGPSSGGGGGGGFNSSGKEEVKLYVGNLSFDTQQETIQKLFEAIGTVTDCFMPTDRDTGRLRGFCFVTMPSAVAEEACNKMNGYELDGRPLRVNEAQPKGKQTHRPQTNQSWKMFMICGLVSYNLLTFCCILYFYQEAAAAVEVAAEDTTTVVAAAMEEVAVRIEK